MPSVNGQRLCKKHPAYTASRRPRCDCKECWMAWLGKSENCFNLKELAAYVNFKEEPAHAKA